MRSPQVEAVVAGSRGFAVALLVPLTERVGVRPRIAADAAQALGLVQGPNGLAVLEVLGDGTVMTIESLLGGRNGLRVIAAVPDGLVACGDRLRSLGVELARWDGTADGVLAVLSGGRAPAVAAGAPTRTAAIAQEYRPAGAPIAAPAHPAAGARAVDRPPPPAPAPAAPATRKPSPTPLPCVRALEPHDRPAAPAAGPLRTAVLDLEALEESAIELDDLALPPQPVPAPPPAPAQARASARAAPVAVPTASAAVAVPAPVSWPEGGPTPDEAEDALSAALAGMVDRATPLGAIAEQVSATLSDLERAVVSGEPVPLDPEPFRRSARMRVRVAAALATVPPPGSPVDAAALSAMLGEIDALLSEVGAAAQAAPPELTPSLEAVRNGLVKEAIDFSEAAQRVAPAGTVAAAAAPVRSARAAATRVLSVSESEEEVPRGRVLAWVLLAVALAAGAGFHGYRALGRSQAIAAAPTLPGQPAGMLLLPSPPGTVQSIVPLPGARIDRAEVERFKAAQRAKGLDVEELGSGELRVRRPRHDAGGRL